MHSDFERMRDEYSISCNPGKLDLSVVHGFLSTSYWSRGLPLDVLRRAIAGSLCFGLYHGNAQVGFARVITDKATFAYLCDVFVLEAYRGKKLSRWLMEAIVIASYNREARDAGKQILEEGGNAFDAFVAATLVEYVVAPGVTSLAGPLNALVYYQKINEKLYLDAELNHVADPEGMWSEGEVGGKGVMVPGALHGLESIHQRYGKLPWARLVQPAIALARDGFPIDPIYSATIEYRAETLKSTPYGTKTFFKNGKPLQSGERLVQPELAVFLEEVAQRGSAAMYRGAWGERCVETVRSRGGRMELQDLHNYRSRWLSPRHIRYRDCDVYGASGRSFGGAWSLLVFRDGRLKIVSGTFNSSLLEGGFQLLVNAIDFKLPAKQAASLPRFGTFSFDEEKPESSSGRMWLDLSVSKEIVDQLAERGLEFEQQSSFVDTGSGAIAILADDGSVDAALLPLVGHEQDEPTFMDGRRE